MRWPFGRGKAAFRMDKSQWRLRVYMPEAEAPALLSVANKPGSNHAIKGFVVPLDRSPDDVDLMHARLTRGRYGIVTPDKQCGLTVAVAPVSDLPDGEREARENARREPDALRTALARTLARDPLVAEITFTEPGPDPMAAAEFLYSVADRIAVTGAGLLRDVMLRRWWQAGQWSQIRLASADNIATPYVAVFAITKEGSHETWVHTLGLYRFQLPELETFLAAPTFAPSAGQYLLRVGSYMLLGHKVKPGEVVGDEAARLIVRKGSRRARHWSGTEVFELAALGSDMAPQPYADPAFQIMTAG